MSDDADQRCPNCGRPIPGEDELGDEPCLPETSPECWNLIYPEIPDYPPIGAA